MVSSFLLKEYTELVVLISTGRLVQNFGAAIEKDRSPKVKVKDLASTRKPNVAERKEHVGIQYSSKSLRHSAQQQLMIFKVINKT